MEYNKMQFEVTNAATLCGRVVTAPNLSHQVEEEKFYEFKIEVERLSKTSDILPVTVSEKILSGKQIVVGDFVRIVGEYRSFNKLAGQKSKLVLHVFAKEVESAQEEFVNEVKLVGFICKAPVYRKTPFNREICDILLAVNRPSFHKSDYVPCILWGRNARFVSEQNIGCKIEVVGRIQSRQYTKMNENGESETKTAYEVSCQRVSLLSNLTTLKADKIDDKEIAGE